MLGYGRMHDGDRRLRATHRGQRRDEGYGGRFASLRVETCVREEACDLRVLGRRGVDAAHPFRAALLGEPAQPVEQYDLDAAAQRAAAKQEGIDLRDIVLGAQDRDTDDAEVG